MVKLKLIHLMFLGFTLFQLAYGQKRENLNFHTRITYDVSYIGDSTNLSMVIEEPCYLFLGNSFALSESVNSFDSTSNQPEMIRLGNGLVRLTWAILKDDKNIRTYDSFSQIREDKDSRFVYTEPADVFNWELQEDTTTIQGFLCQKATCDFGGRTWEAWFSSDLPFSSGPYKFRGLPGLIISISDTKGHWKFIINEIERPESEYKISMLYFLNYKETDKDRFFKDQHYFRANFLELEEAKGIDFMNPENRAIIKENVDNGFKQHSNWIELY